MDTSDTQKLSAVRRNTSRTLTLPLTLPSSKEYRSHVVRAASKKGFYDRLVSFQISRGLSMSNASLGAPILSSRPNHEGEVGAPILSSRPNHEGEWLSTREDCWKWGENTQIGRSKWRECCSGLDKNRKSSSMLVPGGGPLTGCRGYGGGCCVIGIGC